MDSEELRRLAESARASADEARRAADEARRHRDTVLLVAEGLRRSGEEGRAAAERVRRTAAQHFETDTRRAIREEVEISAEIQKSADALEGSGSGRRDRRTKRRR